MLIKSPPSWQMPEREATPEHVFLNRRRFLGALGLGATSLIGGAALAAKEEDPTADLYPAMRNQNYQLDRPLTKERDAAAYNNFYEFGLHKRIAREARALKIRPWTVSFEGMVEKERQVDIDTLIRAMPLEERLYRMRCVEAWSMAVPWSGFPLAELVKYAKPLSSAKCSQMAISASPSSRRSMVPFRFSTNRISLVAGASSVTCFNTDMIRSTGAMALMAKRSSGSSPIE